MSPGRPLGRRQALALLGAGAVLLGAGCGTAPARPAAARALGPGGRPFAEPPVVAGRDGRLRVELVASAGARLGTSAARVLGYNGTSPGPTLRVRPGDELAVRLTNRLDEPTNLHTHGLHVSPEGDGDDPFRRVGPGTSFDYRFGVPLDQPPGTYWYHPHHHGLVADQLFGGLVGAIVVVGDEPAEPVDRLLVVTDISLDADGAVSSVRARERMAGRLGSQVLVNGLPRPGIGGTPGEPQRWRIVNACTSRVLPLRLDGQELHLVGLDGRALPTPSRGGRVVLAAGNRADVVVTPTDPGSFALVADPFDRGTTGMGMGMGMGGDGGGGEDAVVLADLVVAGPPGPATAPRRAPAPPPVPTGPVARRRLLVYGMGGMGGMGGPGGMGGGSGGGDGGDGGEGGGMAFTIDGRTFDPDRDDQLVRAGDVEEWVVDNPTPMVHSFHLHVWPFTVVGSSDATLVGDAVRDVVLVPARGWVRLRIPFTGLTGRTVYHCHVLDHEDAGMMGTIRVVP